MIALELANQTKHHSLVSLKHNPAVQDLGNGSTAKTQIAPQAQQTCGWLVVRSKTVWTTRWIELRILLWNLASWHDRRSTLCHSEWRVIWRAARRIPAKIRHTEGHPPRVHRLKFLSVPPRTQDRVPSHFFCYVLAATAAFHRRCRWSGERKRRPKVLRAWKFRLIFKQVYEMQRRRRRVRMWRTIHVLHFAGTKMHGGLFCWTGCDVLQMNEGSTNARVFKRTTGKQCKFK